MQRERKKKQKAEAKRKRRLEQKAGNAVPSALENDSTKLNEDAEGNVDALKNSAEPTQKNQ